MATTEARTQADEPLSPILLDAAAGRLPRWAAAGAPRREHIARVVALLDEWALRAGLDERERTRWRAAGWLHDALRDADPDELRAELPAEYRAVPGPLLHGPAVMERLRPHADTELCIAVGYHTIGHPGFGLLGQSLYLADFLEPGRGFLPGWRATLRARMPQEIGSVLQDVVAARIQHLLQERKPIRPETAAFWSALVAEAA